MPETTYGAAIVGLGFIGAADQVSGDALGQQVSSLDGTHVNALFGHPRIRLVAGSSRDEGRRRRFAQRTGIPTYADWQEMIAQVQPDIVSVATYAPAHAEITLACAAQEVRAVYCEKPIATRVAEAESMVAACHAAGTLLVVNHNRRFHPNFRLLQDHIAAGGLGKLTSASLQWGTGRLAGVGTHMLDALCMVTGATIQAVSGSLDLSGKPDCRGAQFRDPGAWGLMRLSSGLMVTVDAPDYATVPLSLTVNGTAGRAVSDGGTVTLEYWDGRLERWPRPPLGSTSMDRAVAEIVDHLDGVAPFAYDAAAAAQVLAAIVGFHLSHERNAAWVGLPLSDVDREREVLCA